MNGVRMNHLPSILQLVGLALFAIIGLLIHPLLGAAVLAAEFVGVGQLLERSR